MNSLRHLLTGLTAPLVLLAAAACVVAQVPGAVDLAYNPNVTGGGASVLAIAVQPDGKAIIGGDFTTVGGAAYANLARLNTDGSVDVDFAASANGEVRCVLVETDGKILLGGDFTQVNGTARNRIARLNSDGSIESTATFDPGTGANSGILSMAVQGDGKILLGGTFTSVNGTTHNRVARLNSDGSLESTTTFNPSSGANDWVYCVAAQADGKILLAGKFTSVNGATRNRIARLNANGSIESTATFNPGSGANSSVFSVAVQGDGRILLGGNFTSVNGATRNKIARLNANGSIESTATFNPGSGASNNIESMAVQLDGKILIGGDFTQFNDTTTNFIARLNANGSLESTTTFNPGSGASFSVNSVALQRDARILIGGTFTGVGGRSRNHIARLINDTATQNLSAPNSTQVQWLRAGAGPEVLSVVFDLSTDNGSTWSTLGIGTRITGGWQLTGLSLPASGLLRAVGRTANGYNNGSSSLVEQNVVFPDTIIEPPNLIAPASGIVTSSPISVAFALPEPAMPGSVKFTFDDGITLLVLTLAGSEESQGTHSFSFDPADPTTAAQIASGGRIPDGTYVVSLSYQDVPGNPASSASTSDVVIDTTPPVLNLPADIIAEATGASGAVVTYNVSANDAVSGPITPTVSKASGSVFALGTTTVNVLATDGAGNTQTGSFSVTVQDTTKPALTLPADIIAEATSASGSVVNFAVSASDAVSGAVVPMVSPTSGSTFPLGTTTVNVSATDGAGNTETGSFTVTVRDTTAPAILPGPVIAEATSASGAVVNFAPAATDAVSVPVVDAAPASGSLFPLGQTTVNVTATDAAMNVAMGSFVVRVRDTTLPVLTVPGAIVAEATSASGAVVTFTPTATDAVSAPVVASVPGSGSTFPLGMTTVNVTATDSAGNVAQGSFSVTVQDTTKPTISVPFAQRTTSAVSVPDFTMKAVTSDIVGVMGVTQSPAPGGALALGATVVTLTARDAAGNEADASFTLTRYPPEPDRTARVASGDPLPGSGTLGGGPEGATFTTFGVPAINDAGDVAFTAKWTSPLGPGAGMFAGNPVKLVAQVGGQAPGLGGPTFKALADPVLDTAGRIAFLATLGGAARGEDTVLVTVVPGGPLAVVAREGGTVNGPGTPQIKAFGDVSLVDGEVLFTAKLKGGVPAARAANDAAAFRITGGGMEPVVREGDPLGGSTVKAFKLLGVVGGSPGQSRGHTTAGKATFLALLADGSKALVESTGGVLTDFVATGDATGGVTLPAATFKSFGVVAASADHAAFIATLNLDEDVTAANARGVFLGDGSAFEPVARVSEPVPDIAGASFKAFFDPVLAPDAAALAFPATLRGRGIRTGNDGAILYRPEGAPLRAIAREGGQPPGTPAGAKWKGFVSLALPGGSTGPLFHATLVRGAGGVNATNDAGVWGVDSTGALRLLFREGDPVGDETVKTFTVLNAVRGSTGATRAFNNVAQMVWRANFVGGSSAIVVTSVP